MNIIVGFVCLVAMTVLKGVTGIPEPQPQVFYEASYGFTHHNPEVAVTDPKGVTAIQYGPQLPTGHGYYPNPPTSTTETQCMSESQFLNSDDVTDNEFAGLAEHGSSACNQAEWKSAMNNCFKENLNHKCFRSIKRCIVRIIACVFLTCI